VYHTLRFGRRHGIRTILNPAPGQPLDLAEVANADYVIPNETEAEALGGMPVHNVPEAWTCAESLVARGLRRVIVTMGENGAICADASGLRHVAAHTVTPVDTTGAGDAFIGSLATFLAEGCPENDAIERANVYAALSTLEMGTQKSFVARERFQQEWAKRGKGIDPTGTL
jgi:ribokinase